MRVGQSPSGAAIFSSFPMTFRDVGQLGRALVGLQLLTQGEWDTTWPAANRPASVAQALADLEARGLLTGYQVSRLEKGETDGLVLGRFKLLYRNAAGSFARVFRVCDLQTGRMLGLKLLRHRYVNDPHAVQQFEREAELGKSLKHENIVPIYEVGRDGDQHYFTMEFVEGGNLLDFITIRKRLSPREATKCAMEMAQGLAYAHGRGLMHRDLKLTNVLMSSQGVAKLVDFGLADGPSGRQGEGTQRTLDYATLEKNTGAPRDDLRTDLFFLGVIFYELLTGVPPLPRTRDRAVRGDFERYREIRPIRQAEPSVPRATATIVERLLQLNPVYRYQSAADVLRDLQTAFHELNGDVPPAPEAESESAAMRPRLTKTYLGTVMCVESRLRQQEMLRDYFGKHGYRVLMMSDPERALTRLNSDPPAAVLFLAEGVGEPAVRAFALAQAFAAKKPFLSYLVLSEKQRDWATRVTPGPGGRVLFQPITLRDLRQAIAADMASGPGDSDADSPAPSLAESGDAGTQPD